MSPLIHVICQEEKSWGKRELPWASTGGWRQGIAAAAGWDRYLSTPEVSTAAKALLGTH